MTNSFSIKQFFVSNKAVVRFILTTILLYAAWALVYELVIKRVAVIDDFVIYNSIIISKWILEVFGFVVKHTSNQIWIEGTYNLYIGDSCNGMSLFALFSIIIIALPGTIKHKLVFIPAGIILIHLMNCVRIAALCITRLKAPEYLQFNHDYTFKLLVWGFIFLLWMFWIKKYARLGHSTTQKDAKEKA